MFDQLKQLGKLKELKDALEKEKKEIVKEGVKVIVNGRMEVEEIKLNPNLNCEAQEKIVKDCINEAMKSVQMEAAQKMMHM